MDDKKAKPCTVCGKSTDAECSHVDCPNRKRLTAQHVGSKYRTEGRTLDGWIVGEATRREPYFFE